MSVRYLCIAVLVVVSSLLVTADPCALRNGDGTRWFGPRETLLQCFNAIPFEQTRATATTHVLRQLVQGYSFTDISKNSGAPWNMQVDLEASLGTIDRNFYQRDYDFQADIARLFNQLNDAHTFFGMPAPYGKCALVKPFSLTTTIINGEQQVFLDYNFLISTELLQEYLNFDPAPYIGQRVMKINNQDPVPYLLNYAQTFVGSYKDVNVRVNKLFQGDQGWGLIDGMRIPLQDYQTENLMLSSASGEISLTVPTLAVCRGGFSGTADAIRLLDTPLPVKVPGQSSEGVLALMTSPDIHRETKQRMESVIDTPSFADQIKKRANDAYKSVFSTLHSMMDTIDTPVDNERMLAQAQGSQQNVIDLRRGSAVGLTLQAAASDGSAMFLEYLDERANYIPILRLTTFAPTQAEEYANTILHFRNVVQAQKYDNVIIDVSKNGGGALCFSLMVQAILVKEWAHADVREPENTLWQPYDLRQTPMTDFLFNIGYINASSYLNATTGNPLTGNAFYTSPVERTRGGQQGRFMQQVFFPAECSQILPFALNGQTHWPENVLITTDGTCGSACALFVGKFINNKRGKVVTHGGVRGQDIDAGSFAGGNVLDWPDFLGAVYQLAPNAANRPNQFTSSAFARFNFHQVYLNKNDAAPQEFNRIVSEFRALYWDAVHNSDLNTDHGRKALATLYNTATQAWGDFHQNMGLSPWLIAVIVICSVLGAAGLIVAIIFIVRAVKKRRAKYQVYREDLSTPFHSLGDGQL